MSFTYPTEYLLRHLAANPHNLPRIAGFPQLCNHWANAAKFQLEGSQATIDAKCPYKAGTSAALHWNKGRAD
jgi:hypothetical protein